VHEFVRAPASTNTARLGDHGTVPRPASDALHALGGLAVVASVAVSVALLVDVLRAAGQIHEYQDMDNEAGLASWNYHFGAVQLGAGLISLALLVAAFVAIKGSKRVAVVTALLAFAVGLAIVLGLHHARILDDSGNDPSWTMRACAVAIGVEAMFALGLGAGLILRRSAAR
jgi:hypothetical protein